MIDNTNIVHYAGPTAPHWAGGFGDPYGTGARAMRRKARGFFYAQHPFMVGGVMGGRKACRIQYPVRQPVTSSIARGLATSVDGSKTIVLEAVMPNSTAPEIRPQVAIINGKIKTTSIDIAKHFSKRHDNVIRAIKSLDCSPEFYALNFEEVEYTDDKGEKRPAYEITRDGFTFLAMGFTGKRAAQWKEAYIDAFNAMEQQITQHAAGLLHVTPLELAALIDARVKQVLEGEVILKPDCPKYHYPLSDWQPQTRAATAWLTFRELFRVEPGQRPSARLIKQHQAEGDDVAGVAAEVDALYLLLESFYIKLDRMRSLLGDIDQRGLNIRTN